MSANSSNKETYTIQKNNYTQDFIQELKDLTDGKNNEVKINLERMIVKQAVTLIQLNVQGKNWRLKLIMINKK